MGMFDIVRIVTLLWAAYASAKARSVLSIIVLAVAAYAMGLEVVSGITVRSEGPMVPLFALLLVFFGPSAMPRGHLPALPLASAVVKLPTLVHAGAAIAWSGLAAIKARAKVAEHSSPYEDTRRLVGAAILLAGAEMVYGIARVLPVLLGGELGSGRLGD